MPKVIEKVAGVISLCRHPISPRLFGVERILGPEDLCCAVSQAIIQVIVALYQLHLFTRT